MADKTPAYTETIDWDHLAREVMDAFTVANKFRKEASTGDVKRAHAANAIKAADTLVRISAEARAQREEAGKDNFKIDKGHKP